MTLPKQNQQPIQKRGGIALPVSGNRPVTPPPKPPDAAVGVAKVRLLEALKRWAAVAERILKERNAQDG